MKKKILALMLAVCVSAGSLPVTVHAADTNQEEGSVDEGSSEVMSEAAVAGSDYYWINTDGIENAQEKTFRAGEEEKALADLVRIGETSVYYLPAESQDLSGVVYYGTATLSYTDYYAKDTSVEKYDAVSSATTKKNSIFPNEDSTTPTEEGYQILGVKNVPVAVAADSYVEAKLLEAAEALPENGVYAKAAAITLNETATEAVSQYKMLGEDGTYEATTAKVTDTVKDAAIFLKTTSVWGDYELDILEASTSYIRKSRDDSFAINSRIQGIILEATDGTKVGMRHMEEIWVQPYEVAFNLNSAAAENLIGKTVNKVTFLMPEETYVYEFGENGAYIKPQMSEGSSFAAEFAEDAKTVAVDISNLPKDIENPKVTVYYKQGRSTTYYAENAEIVNGVVALEKAALPNLAYTVVVSSDNYADKAVSAVSRLGDITKAKITLAQSSYTYDGTEKKPAVTVDGLTEGTDYTVAYKNNIHAGEAEVVITGKGNYTGTVTKNFTINKKAVKITASNVTKTVGAKAFSLGAKADNKGTLSYSSSNKKVATVSSTGKVTLKKNAIGKTVITITAKETANYQKAVKKITITVNPKSVTGLKAVSTSKKKVKVSWKKSSSITGYEIQYSTRKNFKGAKSITVKGAKTSSKVISKLSSKKKYYVRIRAYKTVSKVPYRSGWTKAKTVTVC